MTLADRCFPRLLLVVLLAAAVPGYERVGVINKTALFGRCDFGSDVVIGVQSRLSPHLQNHNI